MNDDNKLMGQEDDRERVNSDKSQGLSIDMQSGDDRDPNQETRPPRVQLGSGTNLGYEDVEFDRENYHYYAFLDDPNKPGRIEKAKGAYWESVTNRNGQAATRPAGGGTHHLMRLPIKYWREDLALKKKKAAASMASQEKLEPGQYAPDAKTGQAEGGTTGYQSRHTSNNPYS